MSSSRAVLTTDLVPAACANEYALASATGSACRLLVIPALFDEANKLRHFTVTVMRHLAAQGVDCMLPDLPGTNESVQPLAAQSLSRWRKYVTDAVADWNASHVLGIRGGALLAPGGLPCLAFAPCDSSAILRNMLRTAVMARKEAGCATNRDALLDEARAHGLSFAGYTLGPEMIAELAKDEPVATARAISQEQLGGPALWLRAEPGHDPAQARRLAELIAQALV